MCSKNSIHIIFSDSIARILGFVKGKIYTPGNYTAKNIAMVTDVTDINIECDLVEGIYNNGIPSNIIYSFPSQMYLLGIKL